MTWKLISVLLILTAVADSKAANKKKFSCNRASKLLDKCRKGGYQIGNCVAGDGKLKKKQKKRCTKVDKKFKAKCGEYQCEQQISQGKSSTQIYMPRSTKFLAAIAE
jgi:hypothetical protein